MQQKQMDGVKIILIPTPKDTFVKPDQNVCVADWIQDPVLRETKPMLTSLFG